jgi:hypothetical protein
MTFGGGEDGIGFDVSGLGEVGVSLISAQKSNDQIGSWSGETALFDTPRCWSLRDDSPRNWIASVGARP